MHQLIPFHSFFFKTEISTRASKSLTTKTSKRRSKNSVEGTAKLIYVAENMDISFFFFFVLIPVSSRKELLWLENRLAVSGNE